VAVFVPIQNSTNEAMAPSNKTHSHEEIWDDSALVDSWNDALEEYKVRESRKASKTSTEAKLTVTQKYHSIKARGEDVEEVLRMAESRHNGASVQQSKPR
jgi:hypothetical protein